MTATAFPYRVGAGGRTAVADHRAFVEALVEQIMFVEPGERVNRPNFGCAMRALVFAGARGELVTAVEAMAQSALRQWAGDRIRVQQVAVKVLADTVEVTVQYLDLAQRGVHRVVIAR